MPAQGAWSKERPAPREAGAVLTLQAAAQLREVLEGLGNRLSTPGRRMEDPEALSTLIEAIRALSHRIERLEVESAGRSEQLSRMLELLAARLGEGVDSPTAAGQPPREEAVTDPRPSSIAAQREPTVLDPDPWAIRGILVAACGAAAVSLVGAILTVLEPRAVVSNVVPIRKETPRDLRLRPSIRPEAVAFSPVRSGAGAAAGRDSDVRPPADSYPAVAEALSRGDALALPRLTGLAEAGDNRAQLALASLYETGGAGLTRDLASARYWTRRAAESGEGVAMHNLGLFLMRGDGGGQDLSEAALWFRRAADRGVIDSQYNLGLLYEAGRGVSRNLSEAYRWFTVAANAGDGTSREKAILLETQLSARERAQLDQEAAKFQPGVDNAADMALVLPPATSLAETQTFLARLGYYVGPIDGVASAGLRDSIAAYLRDHPADTAAAARAPR